MGSYCILSYISRQPLPTYRISLKSKKVFVDRRTYGWTVILYTLLCRLGAVDLITLSITKRFCILLLDNTNSSNSSIIPHSSKRIIQGEIKWQEFATRSLAVFFDMPQRCRCCWWISVGVNLARVVNWKQVDVAARGFKIVLVVLQWVNCSLHATMGALSETVTTVSLSTVPRLSLQSCHLRVGKRTCRGGREVSPTGLKCIHAGIKWRCESERQFSKNSDQKDRWEHCKTLRWWCWFDGS